MPTQTIETYDGKGNLLGTRTVTVAQEAVNADDVMTQLASLRTTLTTAYNTMDTIANATGTLTTAQITTQLRQVASAVRFALRTEGRLVRTIIGDYSGTD